MEHSCFWNFKPIKKEPEFPHSWEEFCKMFPVKADECYIDNLSKIESCVIGAVRKIEKDANLLPDRATTEAILALCQLIQLRDCYNQGWVPDWKQNFEEKYFIILFEGRLDTIADNLSAKSPLFFKTRELRDEFLRNFRDLIEKTKPLYGISIES